MKIFETLLLLQILNYFSTIIGSLSTYEISEEDLKWAENLPVERAPFVTTYVTKKKRDDWFVSYSVAENKYFQASALGAAMNSYRPTCKNKKVDVKCHVNKDWKLFSACPSSVLLDCKGSLNDILKNEAFIAKTFNSSQLSEFSKYIEEHPKTQWFLKSQHHANTQMYTAQDALNKLRTRLHSQKKEKPFVLSQQFENPWLYENKVISMRAIVAVTSHSPLRAFVYKLVYSLVAPEEITKNTPCSYITNLFPKGSASYCRKMIKDKLILVNDPTEEKYVDGFQDRLWKKVSNESVMLDIRYQRVQMPKLIWSNMLHTIRTVLLQVERQSSIMNSQCMDNSQKCGTFYGFDFFPHADNKVSLLEVNGLPTASLYMEDVVDEFVSVLGGRSANRIAYIDNFRKAIKSICRETSCTNKMLNQLLDLADERWGFSLQLLKPIFPTSSTDKTIDQYKQYLDYEDIEFIKISSRFLRLMEAYDDGDFSAPFVYSPLYNKPFNLPKPTKIVFVTGTDDSRAAHTEIITKLFKAVSVSAGTMKEFNALTVAGGGDQTFGWLRQFYVLMQKSGHKTITSTIHMIDNNPYQLDLCKVKFVGLKSLSYDDMMLLYSMSIKDTKTINKRKILWRRLLSYFKKPNSYELSLIDESYWQNAEKDIAQGGLNRLDLFIQIVPVIQNKTVSNYNKLCASVSTPVSSYFELYDVIQKKPLTRLPCYTRSIASLPHMSGFFAGGWDTQRYLPSIMELCEKKLKNLNSYFCHTWYKRNKRDVPPPWLEGGLPWSNINDPNVHLKISLMDMLTALEQSKDNSLHFIDLLNVMNVVLSSSLPKLYSLLFQKLNPIGLVLISISEVGGGACLQTGGDYDKCRELLIDSAKSYGLVVEESISPYNTGHTIIVSTFLVLKKAMK